MLKWAKFGILPTIAEVEPKFPPGLRPCLQCPPIGFWLVVPVCPTAASALQPPSTRSRMVARSSEPRHSDATFQRPTSRFFFREAAAATEATSPPCSSLGIEDETPPKNMRWWVHSAVLRIFFLHKNKFDFLCGFPFTFTKSVSDHNSSDLLLNEFRNENEADLQIWVTCNIIVNATKKPWVMSRDLKAP